ncbi:ABC-2 transporter permease [Amycolatopsis rhizosphaerae]|uniref:ABC-2 transporter permease n=1 Tax=Amycolatopsis rhizosphaerae TaxID=2053003 RepID=A0A558D1U8_9PSEU|nr:ABC-2 transporter permease [Amycolatopsis rhizosphaerae]TVT54991.1 ABC-2 transporter permease [Amycolatopsis rhizosphaerae]
MNAVARMALLDLRTVAPYRIQGLVLFGLLAVSLANTSPVMVLPALVLLLTSQAAAHPFMIADKAGLETLYAVLPLSRRSVLYGRYAWALASFLATAILGTALALLFAHAHAVPFDGRTLATMLTLSWALFALSVAIQFPLFIRFGYSRVSALGTVLPLALIMVAVVRLHLNIATIAPLWIWLPVLWVAGVAALAASVAVATATDRRRLPGPIRDGRAKP